MTMARSWPLIAKITQEFGKNPSSIQPNGHTGRDYGVPIGTPVRAMADGIVIYADWANKLPASNRWAIAPKYAGIVVLIDHGGLVSVYAHLNETHLNPGMPIKRDQVVGKTGTTGLSTGPHLHFEVFGWPLQINNGFYGRINPSSVIPGPVIQPAAAPLKANQRRIIPAGVVERSSPTVSPGTKFRVVSNGFITMKGYRTGQNVNGSNLWYVGVTGRVYHVSGFTSQSVAGLPNLTPAPTPVVPPKAVTPPKAPVVAAPPAITAADLTQLQSLKTWLDKFLTTKAGK